MLKCYLMCNKLISRNFCTKLLSNSSKYRIRRAQTKDYNKILQLFQNNFARCEPLVKGLNMVENRYSSALTEFFRNNVEQGMTFVALPSNHDRNPNNPFGAAINIKLTVWDPDQWWKFSSCVQCRKTRDLISLYGFLIQDSQLHKKFRIGKIFHIAHVLVDEEQCKDLNSELCYDKIANQLVDKSLTMAPYGGYRYASVICTGNEMCKIAENFQMELAYEFPYKKLVDEKFEPIVKNVDENSFVKIYTKVLPAPKRNYSNLYSK